MEARHRSGKKKQKQNLLRREKARSAKSVLTGSYMEVDFVAVKASKFNKPQQTSTGWQVCD
jgi:hypothetical protein